MENMHEKDNQGLSANPIDVDARLDRANKRNLRKVAKTGAVAGLIAGAALSIHGPSNEEDGYERGTAERVADQQYEDYQDIIDGADPLDPTPHGVPAPEGAPEAEVFKLQDGQKNPLYGESMDVYEGTNYGAQNPVRTESSDELNVPLNSTQGSN